MSYQNDNFSSSGGQQENNPTEILPGSVMPIDPDNQQQQRHIEMLDTTTTPTTKPPSDDTTASTMAMMMMSAPVEGWPVLNLSKFDPPSNGSVCWLCNQPSNGPNDITFFKPCACPYVHRSCFLEWRRGLITPKNYFYCPTCDHQYTIERVDKNFDPSSLEETELRSQVRWRLALFWLLLFVVIVGSIVLWGVIGWAAERDTKNIPVGISYIVTSVVRGIPDANTTKVWREEFLEPDNPTWPYYGLFGLLISSLIIIIAFTINAVYENCFEDEVETKKSSYRDSQTKSCSEQCHCGGNDCNSCVYCYWYSPQTSDPCLNCNPQACDRVCDAACCHCSRYDCCDSIMNCDSCSGCKDCGGSDSEAMIPVMLAILIIVAIAVVVSAIFIVAYFASQRIERYHAWYSSMVYSRQLELSNKMVVIGKGESLRPDNQV